MNRDGLYKTWDKFKKFFTEDYFDLKEDNELKNKRVGFVSYDTTYQPHVEESHMVDALNNLVKSITSDTTNLTNLTWTHVNLVKQLKVAPPQNNFLTYLTSKTI